MGGFFIWSAGGGLSDEVIFKLRPEVEKDLIMQKPDRFFDRD